MPSASTVVTLTQLSSLIAAALFILGLKRMSSTVTAVSGVRWAGVGMLLATIVTLAFMGASSLNLILVIAAIAIGGIVAWVSGKRVAMTDMPQMIALYNGMGGGAASAIAAIELLRYHETSPTIRSLAILGAIIGTLSFSGSILAYAKLQELIKRIYVLPCHQYINLSLLLGSIVLGIWLLLSPAS